MTTGTKNVMRDQAHEVSVPSMIVVCPITRVHETVEATGATRMISLVSDDTTVERPDGISADHHLILRFHDIAEPLTGYVEPSGEQVAAALDFAEADAAPLLVHCYAGVSRSTAMAYAIACAREPGRCEFELARTMRTLSPTATPNRLIVRLADEALGRDSRMVQAVEAIGRGADAFEGAPFVLEPVDRG